MFLGRDFTRFSPVDAVERWILSGRGAGPSVGMAGRRPMRHLEIWRPIQTFSKRIDFGLTWREGIRLLTGQFFKFAHRLPGGRWGWGGGGVGGAVKPILGNPPVNQASRGSR